jgi:predicted PurR-regulated permease PerM
MKKQITFVIIIFSSLCALAQVTNEDLDEQIKSLKDKISTLQSDNSNLKSEIGWINSKLSIVNSNIINLQSQVQNDSIAISNTANQLGTKIQEAENSSKSSISQLDKDVNNNRLYWIIATLATLLLGGGVYWLLGKRIASSQTDVETQIRNTKKSLEEESLKLDAQLLDIINSQLKIKETQVDNKPENGEKDHSLVLKVADEVTRILMNLEVMDKEIKGYKHLKKYSESILDYLKAYGYEIPQLIGMNYNSGMNMVATLEFDDTIESGKQIIKRIIKPQVNFEGKMIQAAKVTVAFNE